MSVCKGIRTKQWVLELTSVRPVHQRCLKEERLPIAKGRLMILRWAQPHYLLSLRVDEMFCRVAQDARAKLRERVEQLTYADLAPILPARQTRFTRRPVRLGPWPAR